MAFIRWQPENDPFTIAVFGEELSFFYYGNYGGPDYPEKKELETGKKHEPLPEDELTLEPVSPIDYFFYIHDVESNNGKAYNKHQAEADLSLLNSLTSYTSEDAIDAEEALYDGIAS